MKKKIKNVIWLLLPILTSCGYQIPEGDIKDFVDRLDFNLAYQHVNTGKSIVTASYYVNDVEDGKVCSTTYFDKIEGTKYYYINTDVNGSFIGDGEDQYRFSNQQILTYLDDNKEVKVFKKTDGALDNISYREEDINVSINNFFYLRLNAGYHSDGIYYGDYIKYNCAKYYNLFSLNEDKNQLSYKIETKARNSLNDEITVFHEFTVDEFGMIITLKSREVYEARNIVMETTIECEYNIEIEKFEKL